ncbi:transmembrane protein 270 [Ascaphus truei]|uniref:transmembrane protein 270 n=1 Tax=Ascaphus truei TaxID=8439 RepID=UPI003F5A9F70
MECEGTELPKSRTVLSHARQIITSLRQSRPIPYQFVLLKMPWSQHHLLESDSMSQDPVSSLTTDNWSSHSCVVGQACRPVSWVLCTGRNVVYRGSKALRNHALMLVEPWKGLLYYWAQSILLAVLLLLVIAWKLYNRICRAGSRIMQSLRDFLQSNYAWSLLQLCFWHLESCVATCSWHSAYLVAQASNSLSRLVQEAYAHTPQLVSEEEEGQCEELKPE